MAIAVRADRLLVDSSASIIADGAVLVQGTHIIDSGPWTAICPLIGPDDEVVELGDPTQSHKALGEPRFVMANGTRQEPRPMIAPRDSNSELSRQIHAALSSGAGRTA